MGSGRSTGVSAIPPLNPPLPHDSSYEYDDEYEEGGILPRFPVLSLEAEHKTATRVSHVQAGVGASVRVFFRNVGNYVVVRMSVPLFVVCLLLVLVAVGAGGGAGVWAAGGCCDRGGQSVRGSFRDSLLFAYTSMVGLGYDGFEPSSVSMATIGFGLRAVMWMTAIVGTGVVVVKLSRPVKRVRFGRHVFCHGMEGRYATFDVLSLRLGLLGGGSPARALLRAHVEVFLEMPNLESGPTSTKLKVSNPDMPRFYLPWTVAHAMDGNSPIRGFSRLQLIEAAPTLTVTVTGWDPDQGISVREVASYTLWDVLNPRADESDLSDTLQWARGPAPMVSAADTTLVVDMAAFDGSVPIPVVGPNVGR